MKSLQLKTMIPVLLWSCLYVACDSAGNRTDEPFSASAPPPRLNDSTSIGTEEIFSAEEHPEFSGKFTGVIPCSDCEGKQTELLLHANYSFRKTASCTAGQKSKSVEITTGTLRFDPIEKLVVLQLTSDTEFYYLEGNNLTKLDEEGRMHTGPLAEKYVLTR